jgi:toxin secretion/phage lysis holin
MMKETAIKTILTVALAALAAYFQQLVVPITVLIIMMIFDYVSGMASAWVTKELSSRIGAMGIVKKVCYLLVVAVGMVVDYIIQAVGTPLGLELAGYSIFGLLVIVWLILNELISILENMKEIGVPLPGFLLKIVDKLKSQTETKSGSLSQTLFSKPLDNNLVASYITLLSVLGIKLEDISTTALEELATQRLKIPLSGAETKASLISLIRAVLEKEDSNK